MSIRTGLLALVLIAAGAAHAQTYKPPRTPDGRPDFQGVWTTQFVTRIQRPKAVASTIVAPQDEASVVAVIKGKPDDITDPDFEFYDVKALARVKGTLRAGQVVEPADGRIPFTELALKSVSRSDEMFEMYDNPEERDTSERCVTGIVQAPVRPLPMMMPYQFVQTPEAVVFTAEDPAALRIIRLTGDAPPPAVRSRDGWSAGRWDGDTLVVETTHFAAHDPYRVNFGPSLIVSETSRIVERFTRVSATELFYQFTIEDPALYARPWLAEFSFARDDSQKVYEYACHEANYTLANVLKGGRVADRSKKKPVRP